MPLIDVRCVTCGHTFEYMRPLAEWPATPACAIPTCGAATEQLLLPPAESHADPIIVFRAPDGTFRFPGDPSGSQSARYTREGYERVELRGHADVRRFEKVMNAHELSRARRRVEVQQQAREAREKVTRSELRHLMAHMTPFGRQVAMTAIRRNDDKPRERAQEANFHAEVYSFDRSNREPSRDRDGRRRRD